jgi:hypothetical protein
MTRSWRQALVRGGRGWRKLVVPVVAIAMLSVGGMPAGAESTSADQAFRTQLTTYFAQMQRLDAFLRGHAATASLTNGKDTAAIQAAVLNVPKMSSTEIGVLRQAFAGTPGWQQGPARVLEMLQANASRLGGRSGSGTTAGVASGGGSNFSLTPSCDPGIGADPPPGGLSLADVHIAEGVQLAAEVAANISDVLIPDDLDVITAALWGVYAAAGAAVLTVVGIYDTAAECQSIQLDAYIRSIGGDSGDPAQTLVSLMDLKNLSSGVDTKLDAITTVVNNILTKVTFVQTTVNAIQTTVNAIQTTVNNIQSAVATLQSTLDANAERDLRLHIEESLADPSVNTVISFELPQANGGYLEKVRQVVTDSIAHAGSAGLSVSTATSFLAKGNTAFTANDWKSAYSWYGKAYRALA